MILAFTYLVRLSSSAISVEDGSIELNIANIKQLGIFETILSASSNVWLHVIEFPELSREFNMALIGQTGVAKNDHSILWF